MKTQKHTVRKKGHAISAQGALVVDPEVIKQTHKDILVSALTLSVLVNLFVFISFVTINVAGRAGELVQLFS